MNPHTLIIGGTGMLRAVASHFAKEGHTVSVVARDVQQLRLLVRETNSYKGVVNTIPVDYRNTEEFRDKLNEAILILGPITLVVSWIHADAPEAPFAAGEILGGQHGKCRFFDILGSPSANPGNPPDNRKERFDTFGDLVYRKITLGWMEEGSGTRWLTNDDIADGVLAAIKNDAEEFTVGAVRPWDKRPPRSAD